MNKKIVHDALVLFAFTVVLGLILGVVYGITKPSIDQVNYEKTQAAYKQVFEDAASFEEYSDFDADAAAALMTEKGFSDQIDSVNTALDASGNVIGYVLTVTAKDASQASITFSVGIKNDGTVNGYSITNIAETPGLGMKAQEEAFYSQFEGKNVDSFTVVKAAPASDNEIESISGATITSKAMANGVNACIAYFQNVLGLMNKNVERLYNGIIKENPTFVLMLGMCPTLAVTSSAINGLGMGLSTTVVLVLSNLLISAFRKVIPNGVRMPAYIVIVASLVTVVQFMMQAYTPSLSDSLGVYIPLIVVNCIILGRAESYASKNPVVPSIFDGLGMGLGFTLGLTLIGLFRELLGAGQIFGAQVLSLSWFTPITIFVMAPGAFLVAIMNIVRAKMEAKGKPLAKPSGCITGDCAGCGMSATCTGKKPESAAAEKTE